MNVFWIGDRVAYAGRDWEITDVAGNLLGLRDVGTGERLTASLFRVAEECPPKDLLGRGTAALSMTDTLESRVKKAGRLEDVRTVVELLRPDVQEVAFGRAEDATEFRPGYGPGSTLWSRAGAKEAELRALAEMLVDRVPDLAKKLRLSRATLYRKAKAYEREGPAALIDRRMTRHHRVTELVAPEVLDVCERMNRELAYKSKVSMSQRIATVEERVVELYPQRQFKVPGRGRLRKVLEELGRNMYLTGDASNKLSAASVPDRLLQSRPALFPGDEMQIDSTTLDILLIFPNGKVRRPEFAWMIDKATRCVGGTAYCPSVVRIMPGHRLKSGMVRWQCVVNQRREEHGHGCGEKLCSAGGRASSCR